VEHWVENRDIWTDRCMGTEEGKRRLEEYMNAEKKPHHELLERIANTKSFAELCVLGAEMATIHLSGCGAEQHETVLGTFRLKWDSLVVGDVGKSSTDPLIIKNIRNNFAHQRRIADLIKN